MLKSLVPTLSTFTYLRFEFMQEEYLTPEERLRRHCQASLGEQITNYQKKAYDKVQVVSSTAAIGTKVHEMITADFQHMELVTHANTPRDVIICEDKRPIKTMDQVLEELARSARTNQKYWAFGRQHGMGVASLAKAVKEQS